MFKAVVAGYVSPPLRAAGFRRRRSEFALKVNGWTATVAISRDPEGSESGFVVQYGICTPALARWRAENGAAPKSWPTPWRSLLLAQVLAPEWQREDIEVYRWSIPSGEMYTRFTGDLAAAIEEEVIPNLASWQSPRALAAAMIPHVPGRFVLSTPPEAGVALALYEEGPSADLSRVLANLPSDNPTRQWIEAHQSNT